MNCTCAKLKLNDTGFCAEHGDIWTYHRTQYLMLYIITIRLYNLFELISNG